MTVDFPVLNGNVYSSYMVQPITAVSAPGHISTGVLCPLSASMWLEDTATPIAGLAVLLLENLNSQADSMLY